MVLSLQWLSQFFQGGFIIHAPENAGPLMVGGEVFRQWPRAWLQLK